MSVGGDFFSIVVLGGSSLFVLTCMDFEVKSPNFMKISARGDRLKLPGPGWGVGCVQRVGVACATCSSVVALYCTDRG